LPVISFFFLFFFYFSFEAAASIKGAPMITPRRKRRFPGTRLPSPFFFPFLSFSLPEPTSDMPGLHHC